MSDNDYVEMLISQAGGDGEPKATTRGYGSAFLEMLKELPAKALTIKDLENLDAAEEITPKFPMGGLIPKVDSDHDTLPTAA
jgi:hypothetical protein